MSTRRPAPDDLENEKALLKERRRRQIVAQAIGADVRTHRELAGLSQTEMGKIMNWRKDGVSKLERGIFDITVYDFMVLMRGLRDTDPSHPGVALADRYLPRGRAAGMQGED